MFFDEVAQREQLNALTSYIDASMIYGNDDDDSRNLRDFASGRGLMRTSPPASQTQKPLLPPNQGEFIDCQASTPRNAAATLTVTVTSDHTPTLVHFGPEQFIRVRVRFGVRIRDLVLSYVMTV